MRVTHKEKHSKPKGSIESRSHIVQTNLKDNSGEPTETRVNQKSTMGANTKKTTKHRRNQNAKKLTKEKNV